MISKKVKPENVNGKRTREAQKSETKTQEHKGNNKEKCVHKQSELNAKN